MKTKLLILSIAVLCLSAAPAMAVMYPTGAVTFGDGGTGLQTKFHNMTTVPLANSSIDVLNDALVEVYDSAWKVDGAGGAVSTIIMEAAGFSGTNTFGIYDPTNIATKVQVFAGGDSPGVSKVVSILATGEVQINYVSTGVFLAGVNYFGFYLDASIGNARTVDDGSGNLIPIPTIFYSDTSFNPDGLDHMYAYQGKDVNPDQISIPPFAPGDWTDKMYALAFEDLYGPLANPPSSWSPGVDSDRDFTDFVVIAESLKPYPVPAAILLGILGMGVAGLKLRKYA